MGFLAIIGAIFFAFRYGKKSASAANEKKEKTDNTEGKVELGGAGGTRSGDGEKVELSDTGLFEAQGNNKPLSEEEKRRKRASELEGRPWVRPVEIG